MAEAASRHVFTYGSLMFAPVWSIVVEGVYRSLAATLVDHARQAVVAQDYPGMVPRPGATVSGVVYLDVDAADLARLDRFEGDDYRRESVEVMSGDGSAVTAETYVYLPTERLLPAPWEPGAFALQRFLDTYCRDWSGR